MVNADHDLQTNLLERHTDSRCKPAMKDLGREVSSNDIREQAVQRK